MHYILDIMPLGLMDLILSLFFFLLIILWIRSRRPTDYPPGPTPIPLFGNLFTLASGQALQTLRKLRTKYGDIFSLSIGSHWLIVVNGIENLREVFIKNGEFTSDRPPFFVTKLLGSRGIVSTSGSVWKHQRTFALSKLREFGFGKRSFESSIMGEVMPFIQLLKSFEGNSLEWTGILNTSLANVIMTITIGRRFEYNDPELIHFVETFQKAVTNPNLNGPVNFMPSLDRIPGDLFKLKPIKRNFKLLFDFFQNEINEHLESYDENHIRDFIDAYLKEMKMREKPGIYSVNQLIGILTDLFVAGSETTSTTIKWAVLYLIRQPDIQDRMRKELDDTVGDGRFPTLSDRSNLSYSEAVILESLRLGNSVPLSLPHMVSGDIFCRGLKIPRGSILIPSLDSVVYDEALFPDTHNFRPERFLDQNGKLCNQEKILTFSLGKRVCLGESLARMQLFLYLTSLIQRFELCLPEGEEPPPTEGIIGMTYNPIQYKFRAILRN